MPNRLTQTEVPRPRGYRHTHLLLWSMLNRWTQTDMAQVNLKKDDAADEFTPEYCFPPLEARVKAMTREVQKRRANLALSSDLRTGKGNGHGAAVSSLTAVVVEALTIFL